MCQSCQSFSEHNRSLSLSLCSKIVLHELCVRLTHANEHFKQIASAALAEVNAIEPESEFDSFLESNK